MALNLALRTIECDDGNPTRQRGTMPRLVSPPRPLLRPTLPREGDGATLEERKGTIPTRSVSEGFLGGNRQVSIGER